MTVRKIGIVDSQMGNLRSVELALQHLGCAPVWLRDADALAEVDTVVLPGVGAFARAMQELAGMGLVEPLRAWARADRPFLGICLGFQLMFEHSEEDGPTPGLGLWPGAVTALPDRDALGRRLKVPHMGWNHCEAGAASAGSPLAGFADNWFYFVHSYAAPGELPGIPHLCCNYGRRFVAAAAQSRVWGTQFHPERSGRRGLALLQQFLEVTA